MAVELGGISLEHLTQVQVSERTRVARHDVPGMNGSLSQVLGRPSVEVTFQGIFFGAQVADDLAALRQAYARQEPLDFFTEIVGEGYFAQVLVSQIAFTQRAGYLDQFDYTCTVTEYVEPPEPAVSDPFGALDTGLLDEAAGFVDDVQNALEAVSQLADLVASAPSFGDPTERVGALLDSYRAIVGGDGGVVGALTSLRDLLG
jgi:hypothetical protein